MILYVDATRGLSGDMLLAGMVRLGLPLERVERAISELGLRDVGLRMAGVSVNGTEAGRLLLRMDRTNGGPPGALHQIIRWVKQSRLSAPLRMRLARAFAVLGQAEAAAHGAAWRRVVLHQLADPDTAVDFLGFALGLEFLRIRKVHVSVIRLGDRHFDDQGRLRLKTGPATGWLLRAFPVERVGGFEWTTPTGAALMAAFATPEPPPAFQMKGLAHSVGTGTPPGGPSPLRLILGIPWDGA